MKRCKTINFLQGKSMKFNNFLQVSSKQTATHKFYNWLVVIPVLLTYDSVCALVYS